jgi:hypothetical protein
VIDFDWRAPAEVHCERFNPVRGDGPLIKFTDLDGAVVQTRTSSVATLDGLSIYTTRPFSDTELQTVLDALRDRINGVSLPFDVLRAIADAILAVGLRVFLCRGMAAELCHAIERFLALPVDDDLACERRTPSGAEPAPPTDTSPA